MAASDFLDIKPIEPFNFREDTCKLDPLWEKWKKCLSYYMLATATDNDPQKRDIWVEKNRTDFEEALSSLDWYFLPKKNVTSEHYLFMNARHLENETKRNCLRSLVRMCEQQQQRRND